MGGVGAHGTALDLRDVDVSKREHGECFEEHPGTPIANASLGANATQYILLGREPADFDPQQQFKTSLVFTLDEGSGMLFKALSVFALRDINITKIESRP